MNEQKLKGLLGLALRARQISAGTDACRILVRSGKCGMILADSGTASNTRKRAAELAEKAGIPIRFLPEGLIGESTGRSNKILGIRKGGFSEQILRLVPENPNE